MVLSQQRSGQMADSFFVMIPLTLSGGLQDAYSYFMRDGVFDNAQTGNIVLMSHKLFSGDLGGCLSYFIPVLAFALGVLAADLIRSLRPGGGKVHWRQSVLAGEILLLATIGFLPQAWNRLANALISFSCAMQVESFRSVNGNSYASTMCIGNLRSGMARLGGAVCNRDLRQLLEAETHGLVILLFAAGAGVGSVLTRYMGLRTIWGSCLLLTAGFLCMLTDRSAGCLPIESIRRKS